MWPPTQHPPAPDRPAAARAISLRHTHELSRPELAEVRELLEESFDEFSRDDWAHALGGVHAVVRRGNLLVAHGAVVERRLVHEGLELRAGYVEAVAVRARHRRAGHGTAVMRALEQVIRERCQLGALSTSEQGEPFYRALGWQRWRGPTFAGTRRTPDDDGGIYVLALPGHALDLDGELRCDPRSGDPW